MDPLEPRCALRDEGLLGYLRMALNMVGDPIIRRRVAGMRSIFRKYRDCLGAISLVSVRG
jgi:hypothetical protein